uniref:DDE_Tnp_IS1595 domain-containing protein n=1 Tax=Parastrongyloides trichosuri TaxID=131310 RepID=A0A0N4Z1P1_PARTI
MNICTESTTVSLTPSLSPDTISNTNSSNTHTPSYSEYSISPERELTFEDIKNKVDLESLSNNEESNNVKTNLSDDNDLIGIGIILANEFLAEKFCTTREFSSVIEILRTHFKVFKRDRPILKAIRKNTKGNKENSPENVLNKSLMNSPNTSLNTSSTSVNHRLFKNKFWGICKDIGFNEKVPLCEGSVTTKVTKDKRRPGETISKYRCTKCYREQSQQKPLISFKDGKVHHDSSITPTPELTPSPDPIIQEKKGTYEKIGYRECLYIMWSFSIMTPVESCSLFGKSMGFWIEKEDYITWYNALKNMIIKVSNDAPKIGNRNTEVIILAHPFNLITEKININLEGPNIYREIMGSSYSKTEYGIIITIYDEKNKKCHMKHFMGGENLEEYLKKHIEVGSKLIMDENLALACIQLISKDNSFTYQITSGINNKSDLSLDVFKQHIAAININIQSEGIVKSNYNQYINGCLSTIAFFYNETQMKSNFGFTNLLGKFNSSLKI